MKARLFTDGGARGNPGPAAYGFVLEADDGTVLASHGEAIGIATNNVAEYSGLIEALTVAGDEGATEVEIVSDSELLVKQMLGEYKVKHPNLIPLYDKARSLARRFRRFSIRHTLRAGNKAADRLANLAVDRAAGRVLDRRPTDVES